MRTPQVRQSNANDSLPYVMPGKIMKVSGTRVIRYTAPPWV
jgi:hypothetical protein